MFDDLEVKHERTNVDTMQMNEVPERINRILLDLIRMLKNAELPQRFWVEVVATTCYIKKIESYTHLLMTSQEEFWTGNKLSVKH